MSIVVELELPSISLAPLFFFSRDLINILSSLLILPMLHLNVKCLTAWDIVIEYLIN